MHVVQECRQSVVAIVCIQFSNFVSDSDSDFLAS